MHEIDTPGALPSMPTPAAAATPGWFTEGTIADVDWCNAVQGELANIVLKAGLALDKTNVGQAIAALLTLFGGVPFAAPAGTSSLAVPIWATRGILAAWAPGGIGGAGTSTAGGGGGGGGSFGLWLVTGLSAGAITVNVPAVGISGSLGNTQFNGLTLATCGSAGAAASGSTIGTGGSGGAVPTPGSGTTLIWSQPGTQGQNGIAIAGEAVGGMGGGTFAAGPTINPWGGGAANGNGPGGGGSGGANASGGQGAGALILGLWRP